MITEELRRLVGSVMVMGFDGLDVNEHARILIERHHVGNIILFSRNIRTRDQATALTGRLQEWAVSTGQELPLIVCTDQENGIVRRLGRAFPGLPGNMAVAATQDPTVAYEVGRLTALQLRALGINMNLAPVLDVNNNPLNPVIGVRSYGEDPAQVANFGAAMIRGLQDFNVSACAKHFPGHGDTAVDSHHDLPVIAHDRERLCTVEWVPFVRAIESGIDAIMTAHVIFEAFDPMRPATVSHAVLTDILRRELGFDGIITTDSMEMKAIADSIGIGRACVQALTAGADMLMVSHRLDEQEEAIAAVCQAIETGELDILRVQAAAERVARVKRRRLLSSKAVDEAALADTERVSMDMCMRAITVVRDVAGRLPVDVDALSHVVLLQDGRESAMMAADPTILEARNRLLVDELERQAPHLSISNYVIEPLTSETEHSPYPSLEECLRADLILACVSRAEKSDLSTFIHDLCQAGAPVVVLLMRSPYDLVAVPDASCAVALYEDTPWMIRAAARALFARELPSGCLPVSLC